MNDYEKRMFENLVDLKENYGVIGVKAEFESEGTRTEDLIKLSYVANKAGLEICMKIGGCEAIRDIDECKLFNIKMIMAPMIESPFAMNKFKNAVATVFDNEIYEKTINVMNIETITAYHNMNNIYEKAEGFINAIVVGRVDLSASMNLTRQEINSEIMFNITKDICKTAKSKNIITGVGGGISKEAIDFLKRLEDNIDRFETRKVIFNINGLNGKYEEGILKAVEFEYFYLKNKFDYYNSMAKEDIKRLELLEKRIAMYD